MRGFGLCQTLVLPHCFSSLRQETAVGSEGKACCMQPFEGSTAVLASINQTARSLTFTELENPHDVCTFARRSSQGGAPDEGRLFDPGLVKSWRRQSSTVSPKPAAGLKVANFKQARKQKFVLNELRGCFEVRASQRRRVTFCVNQSRP